MELGRNQFVGLHNSLVLECWIWDDYGHRDQSQGVLGHPQSHYFCNLATHLSYLNFIESQVYIFNHVLKSVVVVFKMSVFAFVVFKK